MRVYKIFFLAEQLALLLRKCLKNLVIPLNMLIGVRF